MQFGWNIYPVGVDLCCRRTLCYQIIHGYRSEPRSFRGTNARVRYRDLGRDVVSRGRSLKSGAYYRAEMIWEYWKEREMCWMAWIDAVCTPFGARVLQSEY